MGICKLSENGHWAVDGIPIYIPSGFTMSKSSILSSDSKRTESGKKYLTVIRPDVSAGKLVYDSISAEEVAELNARMLGKEFIFTYEDNGAKTMRAFAGKSSYSIHRLNVYPEYGGLYKNYTIDIEEI